MHTVIVQCEWEVHPEYGPLLPLDVHVRGLLQLPLLHALPCVHDPGGLLHGVLYSAGRDEHV